MLCCEGFLHSKVLLFVFIFQLFLQQFGVDIDFMYQQQLTLQYSIYVKHLFLSVIYKKIHILSIKDVEKISAITTTICSVITFFQNKLIYSQYQNCLYNVMIARNIQLGLLQVFRYNNYSIRLLTNNHKKLAVKFVRQLFQQQQPSQVAFYKQFPQQKKNSYLFWDRVEKQYGQQIFDRELSFGSFDLENDSELVGAVLTRDNAFIPKNDIKPEEGTFLYAVNLIKQKMMAQVIPEYFDLVNKYTSPVIDVWLVAVSPKHQKKGLLHQMLQPVERFGLQKSYQYSISWASNVKTGYCLNKLGYKKISEVDVRDFEHKGVRYFKELDEKQKNQSLWLKDLRKNPQMPKM